MNAVSKFFLACLILVGVSFEVRMLREFRQARRGRRFYPIGLTFCCFMQAMSAYPVWGIYTRSMPVAITASILSAFGCFAVAYGIAANRGSRT